MRVTLKPSKWSDLRSAVNVCVSGVVIVSHCVREKRYEAKTYMKALCEPTEQQVFED